MKVFRKKSRNSISHEKKYENNTVFLKIQFSIDLTGSQGGVIGSNESFEKSFEKNDENDNLG